MMVFMLKLSGNMLKMSKNVKFALLCNRKNEKMADFCGFAGVFCARGGKVRPKWAGWIILRWVLGSKILHRGIFGSGLRFVHKRTHTSFRILFDIRIHLCICIVM